MVEEEKYIFNPATKSKLIILLVVGLVLTIGGLFLAMYEGNGAHEEEHASLSESSTVMTASLTQEHDHEAMMAEGGHEEGEHNGSPLWLKRLYASLWMNNMLFLGFGIIGLFFVAIQYAASVGWSAGMKRIPLAMGNWIPYAGILTLVLWFIVKGDLFHWSHADVYVVGGADYDQALTEKSPYFFWPGPAGGFPIFYIFRMVLFFSMWYMFYIWIKKQMTAEDIDGDTKHWFKARGLSTWFLIFFAVSSSIASWDWMMSLDPHWFSTMYGWYLFATWWVAGLAMITLVVVMLKEKGYLKIVNANHLHDLGKFIFAFSIFWGYIWFGQFLLIYYANIPEETVYFIQRMRTSPYGWVFYATLIGNFLLPFLLFMTRESKRHFSTLKVVCSIVIIGHWFDFYEMVTPAVMQERGGVGFLEIGVTLVFLSAFMWIVLSSLSKIPLIGRNHPMLEESLQHHI